eukprot:1177996-Prorocentrum_minimum.AAC.1
MDSVSVAISEARPALPQRETRSVVWAGGVRLEPDRASHRFDLVLDSVDLAGLLPLTELWETQVIQMTLLLRATLNIDAPDPFLACTIVRHFPLSGHRLVHAGGGEQQQHVQLASDVLRV